MAVIVEVGFNGGFDSVVAYREDSPRYLNLRDPLGGPVIASAIELMKALVGETES